MRAWLCALLISTAAFAADGSAVNLSALRLGAEVTRVQHGNRLYVALEEGGVAVIDVSNPAAPRLLNRLAEGRRASRLVVDGELLLVIETRNEVSAFALENPASPTAVALSSVPLPRAPVAPAEPQPQQVAPPPSVAVARVVAVQGGRVIFDAGTASGFTAGTRVRVISQRLETRPDLVTGEPVQVPSNETTAVVRIEQAEAERAMAQLGRGDVVEVGDEVAKTDLPISESLFVPRRAPFQMLYGFHLRPFLGLGGTSKPVGVLADAYFSYYLDQYPIVFSASVAPIGFAIGSIESHYPGTFAGTVAYAQDYFEIGFGAGGLMGNIGPCFEEFGPTGPLGTTTCEENTGFTLNQTLRLGALDGVNISWRSSIFSRPGEFVFGVGRAELNLPLTSQLGVFAAGGGGENGWNFGEAGVRTYLGGTGARGTTILSASLGYASIFDGPAHETVGGPSVAVGLEWRR